MRLHHVAFVTPNIEQKLATLSKLLGCEPVGSLVTDNAQGVRIQFVRLHDGSLIELLEPHGENSPVQRHLKRGGGIYHVCFEVPDLEGTLKRLRATGDAMIVREPTPAPAIEFRRVAFVVTADQDLFEFVEAER